MSWLDPFAIMTNPSYLRSYVDTGETDTGSQFLESSDGPEQVLQDLHASREQFHFIAVPWAFIPQKAGIYSLKVSINFKQLFSKNSWTFFLFRVKRNANKASNHDLWGRWSWVFSVVT